VEDRVPAELMLSTRGFPLVLAAPSGAGKTTIARALVDGDPRFVFSVSVTTREPRLGERDGVDYTFVDRSTFDGMIQRNELCEYAEVHGNMYGTPFENLELAAVRGEYVVLDIDVQGARQIRHRLPEAVLVFVFPPSAEALLGRLTSRRTEKLEEVARRLRNARKELAAAGEFDYVVVNDELESAVRQVREIVHAEGHRPGRSHLLGDGVERLQASIDRILEGGFERTGT
jgi:guanylate kinase